MEQQDDDRDQQEQDLIRVGPTRYVASNPAFPSGEFVSQIVFDSAFALKATYLK